MLVITLKTGLTHNRNVYREGDVFEIKKEYPGSTLLREFPEDISEEEWTARQMKMYGEILFRRLSEAELKKAYGEGKVELDMMNDEQKKIIKAGVSSKIAEMRALSEQMKKEVEEEEEKEVEETRPRQVVQEGSESVPTGKKK